jgi:prepilin-type N-terminal cleavage/methylation domain-containing protein
MRCALTQRLLRRISGEERGFTLIELMITAALLAFILFAILAISDTTTKHAVRDQERAHVIREAQVGLHRMTRELRQAYTINSSSATAMNVQVLVNGTATTVSYDCSVIHPTDSSLRRCVRTVGVDSVVVVDRMKPGTVFTYDGNSPPRYVQARVSVPAKGERVGGHPHYVVLDDGFYMRNLDV